METQGKETIISKSLAIAGWVRRRGHYFIQRDEKNFERVDRILKRLVEDLREYIKDEPDGIS